METVEKEDFWGRVVAAPGEFESLVTADAAWNACAAVVWRVVGGSLVLNGSPMLVAAWEENLGLEPAEGDGVPARKAAVLQRLCDMGLPVTVACLEAELARRIGEGMAGVSLSGGTLTVSLALTATEAQIAAVEQLLGRVLPQALVTEMEWADGLPFEYKRIEYLESTPNDPTSTGGNYIQGHQWINTGLLVKDLSFKLEYACLMGYAGNGTMVFGVEPNAAGNLFGARSVANSRGIGYHLSAFKNSSGVIQDVCFTDVLAGSKAISEINLNESYIRIEVEGRGAKQKR